jgi:hypothetical protein
VKGLGEKAEFLRVDPGVKTPGNKIGRPDGAWGFALSSHPLLRAFVFKTNPVAKKSDAAGRKWVVQKTNPSCLRV